MPRLTKTKYLLISDLSDGDHIEMNDYYDRNSFRFRPFVFRIHDGLTSLKVKLMIARKTKLISFNWV
tara:strand:+ start:354 stop:554 length:201 start_codon:yes stop_codon:yes gene_type:complete